MDGNGWVEWLVRRGGCWDCVFIFFFFFYSYTHIFTRTESKRERERERERKKEELIAVYHHLSGHLLYHRLYS